MHVRQERYNAMLADGSYGQQRQRDLQIEQLLLVVGAGKAAISA
jgi:hypothetical protein